MSYDDLQKRVSASAELRRLQTKITDAVAFRSPHGSQFDPFLVLMIIGIIVNIVLHCRQQQSAELIKNEIRNIRTLPAMRLARLRRQIKKICRDRIAAGDELVPQDAFNSIMDALYEVGELADDEELDALLLLAADWQIGDENA